MSRDKDDYVGEHRDPYNRRRKNNEPADPTVNGIPLSKKDKTENPSKENRSSFWE